MENEIAGTCINNLPEIAGLIIGGLVVAASAASNFISKTSVLGKVINWIALNIRVEKKK